MARDPYKYFRIESGELLEELNKAMLALEKGQQTQENVARLLRLAHTLKGAARVVKQREIADHAHSIEDMLVPLRDNGTSATREQVDRGLKLLDEIGARIASLASPDASATPMPPAAIAGAAATAEAPAPREETYRTLRTDGAEVDALLECATEAGVQLAEVQRHLDSLEQARQLADLIGEQLISSKNAEHKGDADARMRSMIDELRKMLVTLERTLAGSVDQADRELREVHETAERLRLLPVSMIFGSLERTARDAAVSLQKRVVFEAQGDDVRLDADVLNTVQRAMVQAVRNAVAHGIELPLARAAAGKSPEGRITVKVHRRNNRVTFLCEDDGGGLDLEAIGRVAEKRGMAAAEARKLSPEELLSLLLKGGISTSSSVTEVSGRGVGLDVVRDTARRLGGQANIRANAQAGTTLELNIPVSMASLDALVVEVSGQTAAIPLSTVQRALRLESAEVMQTGEGESIVSGETVIPFTPLSRSLGRSQSNAASRKTWSAVVVVSGNRQAAFGVDRLIGTQNVVLRALPPLAQATQSIAGAMLDARGNPQWVLDPEGLIADAFRAAPSRPAEQKERVPILVVDDSLTTRMLEQSILESAGYPVETAICAEDALAMARERHYALFLVDVDMPGMDGFTFVQQSRADPVMRDTPAILVTSRNAPEDRARGKAVGASAYIVKSEFDQVDLLERIRKLVG